MEKLGIDIRLIISQIINFLILLFLLKKLIYKPIIDLFKERKKLIEKTFTDFEEAKKELAESGEKGKEMIREAATQGAKIINESQKQGGLISEEITRKAEQAAKKMLDSIKVDKDELIEEVGKLVSKRTASIVAETTKSVLAELDEDTQTKIVEKVIDKLPKSI